MSYEHLSPEERIEKASEYALILVGEVKSTEVIIAELARTFSLSPAEATAAYERTQQEYHQPYTAIRIRNMINTLLVFSFLATVISSIVYLSGVGTIDKQETGMLKGQVVDRKIGKASKQGQYQKHTYLLLHVINNRHTFSIPESYYNAGGSFYLASLLPGDTVTLVVSTEDLQLALDTTNEKVIDLLNVYKDGKASIDHEHLNESKTTQNRTWMFWSMGAFGLMLCIAIAWRLLDSKWSETEN